MGISARSRAGLSYWRNRAAGGASRFAGAKLEAAIGAIPCAPLDEATDTTLAELHLTIPHGVAVATGAA